MLRTGKRWLCLLISLLAGSVPTQTVNRASMSLPLQSSDEAALRSAVEQYFTAYGSKSLEEMLGMWSARSPELEVRRKTLENIFAGAAHWRLTRRKVAARAL